MKTRWTIAHDHHLIVARLNGAVTQTAIETCLADMAAAQVDGYRRILDLSDASFDLDGEEIGRLIGRLASSADVENAVALLVPPALAPSLAATAGAAGVKIFAASAESREWLDLLARAGVRN